MEQQLIFLDTETTGRDEKDRLCQVAYRDIDGTIINKLYNPGMLIPPEASAVHHISNAMVTDALSFQESDEWKQLKQYLEEDGHILVAHNAQFDVSMLERENIKPKHFICTLRLARHLDSEGVLPKYNLQYLRYLLDLNVEATAHDAEGDVIVLEKLYERLYEKIQQAEQPEDVHSRIIEISMRPSLIRRFPFGKYRNMPIADIAREDPDYLQWLYKQKQTDEAPDEDWIYTLKHYLNYE